MHKILATMLLFSFVGAAEAQQIGQSEAAQIARSFWSSAVSSTHHRVAAVQGEPVLAYTAKTNDETEFYVFNNSAADGFVIVGGDKKATEILGYSFNGSFDYDSAPEGVRWLLSQYQQQIHNGIAQATSVSRATVDDFITTKWDQSAPFNAAIPQLPGHSGNTAFATGCVPTAMAQVMKKYNYPEGCGIGSNEYQKIYNNGSDTIVFQADFSSTTYDWANMKNSYSSSSKADAAAKLIYHCGVSVNANYGQINGAGTSASNSSIPKALINYFGYDKGMQYVNRHNYTDEEWESLIYNEISAGRPVIYGGISGNVGHAFIIHGYSSSKKGYAINWGWGGAYDGYYALTGVSALKPSGSGIGGAGNGAAYTSDQDAVIGIRPDVGSDYVWQLELTTDFSMNTLDGKIATPISSITIDKNVKDESLYFYIPVFNTSVVSNDFVVGLQFIDENSKQSKIVENIATVKDLTVNSGIIASWTVNTSLLEYDGTYSVYPVFRLANAESSAEWKRINMPKSVVIPTITIQNAKTPESINVDFSIGASAIKEESSTTITWNNNYAGSVTYSVDKPSIVSIASSGNQLAITGKSPGTATVTVKATENGYYLATERTFEVTVTEVPVVPVTMSISGTEVATGETLQISHDPAYTGVMSYSCDKDGIVSIDENGKVTAIAEGTVRITATAEGIRATGDQFYTRTVEYFDVTVISEPRDIYITSVTVPNNGYFTTDGFSMDVTFKNNSGADKALALTIKMQMGNTTINSNLNGSTIYKGESVTYNITSQDYSSMPDSWNPYIRALNNGNTEITTSLYIDGELMQPTEKSQFILNLVNKKTVTATVAKSGWGTVMLPFEGTLPEGLKAYSCGACEGNLLTLSEVENSKLNMDTPYILYGKEGSYSFTGPEIPNKLDSYSSGLLTATTTESEYSSEAYVLDTRDGYTAFYKLSEEDSTAKTSPYVAFVVLPDAGNVNEALYLTEEDAKNAGISEVECDGIKVSRHGVYSVNGMLLRRGSNTDALPRGLYIINGNKISIK